MRNFYERKGNLVAAVFMLTFGTVFFFIFGYSFYTFKSPFYISGFFFLLSLYLAISMVVMTVNGLRFWLNPVSVEENVHALPKKDINNKDQWDIFWVKYMEWTIRGVCYFSNFLFFKPIKQIMIKNLSDSSLYDIIILTYSMGLLTLIEKVMRKKFNPKYEHLEMSAEELTQRVVKERIIYSALLFSVINCAIALPVGIATQDISPGLGIFAIIWSLMAVFGGVMCLVGRDENGYRRPKVYPLGMIFLFLPTGFIIHMALTVFLG